MWTIPEPAAESNPADGLPATRRQVYTRLAMRRGGILLRLAQGITGCGNQQLPPPDAAPLLILAGANDDWTPAESCQKLADAAREAGRPITIVVYPDARHHFDGAHLKRPVFVSIAKGGKGATIEYNPKAHEDSEKKVKNFLAAQLRS